jgi:hypothetical protein
MPAGKRIGRLLMACFKIELAQSFDENAERVDHDLRRYFGGKPGDLFTGRWFDHFAAMGDPNRFEASDIVAVESLSVEVPSEAAASLLINDSERFNALLRAIPREVDLWTVGRLDVSVGSAADDMHAALKRLPKVGGVTAGKLMAAKRPRLIPIFDDRVDQMLARLCRIHSRPAVGYQGRRQGTRSRRRRD